MTEDDLLYLEKELGTPALINLFKFKLGADTYYFCSDFRLDDIWWNNQKWIYAPLLIDEYRFSEDNNSVTPTLSCVNLATLYSDAIANLPQLEGAQVTYYQVYASEIKTLGTDHQSSMYLAKFDFILTQLLVKNFEKLQYRIDPIGFMVNQYAPVRVILRNGLPNASFPACGQGYSQG